MKQMFKIPPTFWLKFQPLSGESDKNLHRERTYLLLRILDSGKFDGRPSSTSFPGSLLFTPQEAREGRPWLGLVTCLPEKN